MSAIKQVCQALVRDDEGAVLVEYVLLIVLIAIVALVGIRTFGLSVTNKFGDNNGSVSNAIN
jgi:Flp pilus assembly pilin Flp